MNERSAEPTEQRALTPDIGGDPEAAAGAIPNLIAGLVETETWRNAATVLLGLLLMGLGYWTYTGVRTALAETRAASLEALLGTVVTERICDVLTVLLCLGLLLLLAFDRMASMA